MADRPLSPRQQRFVDEYLVDLNASAAYVRAGYRAKNGNVAGVSAHHLLKTPKVAAAVAEKLEDRSRETGITAAWALERLKIEAEYDGEDSSHSARVAALNLAMKHLGMLTEKIDAHVKVSERPRVVEIPVDATPGTGREVR